MQRLFNKLKGKIQLFLDAAGFFSHLVYSPLILIEKSEQAVTTSILLISTIHLFIPDHAFCDISLFGSSHVNIIRASFFPIHEFHLNRDNILPLVVIFSISLCSPMVNFINTKARVKQTNKPVEQNYFSSFHHYRKLHPGNHFQDYEKP